jgi:hypothetical protein
MNLRSVFSVGIIAFVLVTLQGCAPPSVTRASAKEPGASLPPLGSLRADEAPRAVHRHVTERGESERAAARPLSARSLRPEYCRRCSAE